MARGFWTHFKAFTKKNLIMMQRTKATSIVEVILPLILIGLLVLLRYLIYAEDIPRMTFPEVLMNDRNHFDFYTLMHFPLYQRSRSSSR